MFGGYKHLHHDNYTARYVQKASAHEPWSLVLHLTQNRSILIRDSPSCLASVCWSGTGTLDAGRTALFHALFTPSKHATHMLLHGAVQVDGSLHPGPSARCRNSCMTTRLDAVLEQSTLFVAIFRNQMMHLDLQPDNDTII